MTRLESRSLNKPDETQTSQNRKVEAVNVAGGKVVRFTLQPGWRWSQHVKPLAGTERCKNPHFGYHISGRLHIVMADGSDLDIGPSEVAFVPAGHDAWVVGDEPVVVVDWTGITGYAKG
ncbi:MAG: cupin [SAR202 cluster bacterium]|nr:cupin [SAR202 cluster bacterium]